tara:strand:+ start:728 stop:1048 length:321 start_codon:yes stop_codon:yes gene_type:complete
MNWEEKITKGRDKETFLEVLTDILSFSSMRFAEIYKSEEDFDKDSEMLAMMCTVLCHSAFGNEIKPGDLGKAVTEHKAKRKAQYEEFKNINNAIDEARNIVNGEEE